MNCRIKDIKYCTNPHQLQIIITDSSSRCCLHQVGQKLHKNTENIMSISVETMRKNAHLHSTTDDFNVYASTGMNIDSLVRLPLRMPLLLLMISQACSQSGTECLFFHLLLHRQRSLQFWARVRGERWG
jgi:hypothetical protein